MRTSGLFQTTSYHVTLKSCTDHFYLVPFSDIHRDHPSFPLSEWREFCKWGRKTKNAHFIGNGDYLEFYRAHTRSALLNSLSEDERFDMDKTIGRKVDSFAKEIDFMRGRLIGLGDGNHTWKFVSSESSEQRLARTLGVPHLGVSAVVRITVECNSQRSSFLYAQHHGVGGGGTTPGAAFNTVANWAKMFSGVTIYAMGDNHGRGILNGKPKLEFFPDPKSDLLRPRAIPQFYCRTGSFKRIYEPGESSYEIDRAYAPTDIGVVMFKIKLNKSERHGLHLNFQAIT